MASGNVTQSAVAEHAAREMHTIEWEMAEIMERHSNYVPPEMCPGSMACQDGSPEMKAYGQRCTTYYTDSTPEIGPSNFPATVYTRRVLSAVCLFHGLHTYTYTEFQKMAAGIRPTDLYRPLDSLLHILLLVLSALLHSL